MILLFIFMYIFGFNIIGPIDSTILVGLILSFYMIFDKKFSKIFNRQFCNKKFLLFLLLSILLIFWSILIIAINFTYDYSYIKTFIHFIITIIIGVELLAYIESKNKTNKIVNYIIICLCAQSIFQMICYAFPNFSAVFDYFRSQQMIEISSAYNGFRGIALTKSGFFSLSSAYAVSFVMFFSKYNTISKKLYLKSLILILLIIGTFFAGRTGFIGLIYAILIKVLYLFYDKTIKFNLVKIFKILLVIFILIITIINFSKVEKIQKLYSYVFESFYNLSEGKGFNTASTDVLIDMYDIDISFSTILIGDGKYYEKNGNFVSYYKKTDSGYLRKILYFGFFGFILSLLIQLILLGDKINKREKVIMLILLLILEIKGEIIGLNIMIGSIITLYSRFSILKKKEEIKCQK